MTIVAKNARIKRIVPNERTKEYGKIYIFIELETVLTIMKKNPRNINRSMLLIYWSRHPCSTSHGQSTCIELIKVNQ